METVYMQFFLTVNEGKWLIARAVAGMERVQRALRSGKVILKGGTTVSCISELLVGYPLKISGRMTPEGAMPNRTYTEQAYGILIENGQIRGIDAEVDTLMPDMGPGDVVLAGANLFDVHGAAAILAGSPGGFRWGRATAAMISEGADVIIPVGLEKLIPGSVNEAMKTARRQGIRYHDGMACGLFPLVGDIVTEIEAVKLLADVEPCVIGRGGIQGAEGGTLFQVSGPEAEVERLREIVSLCKNQKIGGDPASLQ